MGMDDSIKEITEFARRVKRTRKAEQQAYKRLTNSSIKLVHSFYLAEKHEIAMIATTVSERDLATLVIRLLVDKKR